MKTQLDNEAYELKEQMIIAADMIANLKDRKMIYALINAAEQAVLRGWNPRRIFLANSESFPHIKLDMSFKNWDE